MTAQTCADVSAKTGEVRMRRTIFDDLEERAQSSIRRMKGRQRRPDDRDPPARFKCTIARQPCCWNRHSCPASCRGGSFPSHGEYWDYAMDGDAP